MVSSNNSAAAMMNQPSSPSSPTQPKEVSSKAKQLAATSSKKSATKKAKSSPKSSSSTSSSLPSCVAPTKKSKCLDANKCVCNCMGYGRVCPVSALNAGKAAHKAIQKLTHDSQIFDANVCQGFEAIPKWDSSSLQIGEKLGQGGFSQVHKLERQDDDGQQTYAIKYLRREVMVHQKAFELGASDLAVEGYILATLSHPHIVSLHAMTKGNVVDNLASGHQASLFIVIDYLETTLERQIEVWKETLEYSSSNNNRNRLLLGSVSPQLKQKRQEALYHRLSIAKDLASAMQYLHKLGMVYRDLKPDNVGFDSSGQIKMFDFGLAKELHPSLQVENGNYKLTGKTGSRRYMAPEVALELSYNQSVDVYSFGIVLWEMCSLEKPFYGYSTNKHQTQVVIGNERPTIPQREYWPMELQWLLQKCWSRQSKQRPSFEEVIKCLDDIIIMESSSDKGTTTTNNNSNTTTSTKNPKFPSPASPQASRVSSDLPPPPNFKTMKKPTKGTGRARTWGFPMRKQG